MQRNIARNVNKNIKRLERVEFLMVKRFFITLGYGILTSFGIKFAGFILGTLVYVDEGSLHHKIDAISNTIGDYALLAYILVSMIFVVRFMFYRNQSKILKSVQ